MYLYIERKKSNKKGDVMFEFSKIVNDVRYYEVCDIHDVAVVCEMYLEVLGIYVEFEKVDHEIWKYDNCYTCEEQYATLFNCDQFNVFIDYDIWNYLAEQIQDSGWQYVSSNENDDLIQEFGEEVSLLMYHQSDQDAQLPPNFSKLFYKYIVNELNETDDE